MRLLLIHLMVFSTNIRYTCMILLGIRAGARKTGRNGEVMIVKPEQRESYFPATQHYAVEEVMLDLLQSSALLLQLGGFLAYLIPTPHDFIPERDLPCHPCLHLIACCKQALSTRHGRHLVLMRKTKSMTTELKEEFLNYKQRVLSGDDDGFGKLIAKLQLALSAEGMNNETVVKQVSNRCAKRKEKRLKQQAMKAASNL